MTDSMTRPYLDIFDGHRPMLPCLVARLTLSETHLTMMTFSDHQVSSTVDIPVEALKRFLADNLKEEA